jgi:hypothetical protein
MMMKMNMGVYVYLHIFYCSGVNCVKFFIQMSLFSSAVRESLPMFNCAVLDGYAIKKKSLCRKCLKNIIQR